MKSSRHISILTVALAMVVTGAFNSLWAQSPQTLFKGEVTHGVFGSPVVKIGEVAGSTGVWAGGRGGWIINMNDRHAVSLGLGGYGLVSEHRIRPNNTDDEQLAMNGYGGLDIEYTNQSYRVVHLTLSSLIGGGGLMGRNHHFDRTNDDRDRYFIFEPGLNVEVNITELVRVSAGASYKLISGINRFGFRDSDFSGFNGVLSLKFGRF